MVSLWLAVGVIDLCVDTAGFDESFCTKWGMLRPALLLAVLVERWETRCVEHEVLEILLLDYFTCAPGCFFRQQLDADACCEINKGQKDRIVSESGTVQIPKWLRCSA